MMPDTGQSALAVTAPAHAIYVAGDESLRYSVLNAASGVTVRASARFMHLDGRVEPIVDRLVPATDRSVSTKTIPLAQGWLIHAQASVSGGTPQIGQTFAVLSLVRGRTGASEELATLAAGPISAVQRVSWPGSGVGSPLEGAGALRHIQGTNPGAGNAIAETVPTGARWQFLYIKFNLATSGVAGNRTPYLDFDDGTNYYFEVAQGSAQAASGNRDWFFVTGFPDQTAANTVGFIQGVPPLSLLPAGHRVRISATGLDAGDVFSSIRYTVREWIEGA